MSTDDSLRTDPARVDILYPLCGLAALIVAWFHLSEGLLAAESRPRSTGADGWHGVEVFCVIPSFVLPLSLCRGGYRLRSHAFAFALKRIVHLNPLYIVTIALAYASALVPSYAGNSPAFTWTNVLLCLGYLNAFAGQP